MRRLLLASMVAAMIAAPFAGHADDINDAAECRAGTAEAVSAHALGESPSENDLDRGAVCVNAEGTTVLYVGGEAQAEEDGNPDFGGACGAIIVADENLTGGDEDWNAEDGSHCD